MPLVTMPGSRWRGRAALLCARISQEPRRHALEQEGSSWETMGVLGAEVQAKT